MPSASVLEIAAAASSLARDIYAVAEAAHTDSPSFSQLAERATVNLTFALREAAGSPRDERWRSAYDSLNAFVAGYLRCSDSARNLPQFVRLSRFLAENADLAPHQSRPPRSDRS